MTKTIHHYLAELEGAASAENIWEGLLEFLGGKGLEQILIWLGQDLASTKLYTTCPDWWLEHYMEKGLERHDHVRRHGLHGQGVLAYGLERDRNDPRVGQGALDAMREARGAVGVGAGCIFPTFLPDGTRIGGVNLFTSGTADRFDRLPTSNVLDCITAAAAAHTRLCLLDRCNLASADLSPREKECLLWLCKGLRTKEIADRLHLSDATILFHVNNAKAKLGADTREQAVARAVALGLVVP
jgi:DNA-binding CsgD family transcriptional regulator